MIPEILYEDPHLLVCIKPAGLATQSSQIGMPDLVHLLKNHIHQQTKKPPYLAIIHRLDQPVQGLLVFGKTKTAAKELNQQLNTYGFGKHYLALLSGIPNVSQGTLTDYLLKDGRTNISHICSKETVGAKRACLHYEIIDTFNSNSLAKITLETGRHHQIRVQMAHLGTPILGDQKYGSPNTAAVSTLQLFAYKLSFSHPSTHKKMDFQLEIPFECHKYPR